MTSDFVENLFVPAAVLNYPMLFTSRSYNNAMGPRYSTSFTVLEEDEGQRLLSKGVRFNKGMFHTSSNYAPVITTTDYDLLAKALQIADARNMSREKLFQDMTVGLHLQVYEYEYRGEQGKGAALVEVEINNVAALVKAAQTYRRVQP